MATWSEIYLDFADYIFQPLQGNKSLLDFNYNGIQINNSTQAEEGHLTAPPFNLGICPAKVRWSARFPWLTQDMETKNPHSWTDSQGSSITPTSWIPNVQLQCCQSKPTLCQSAINIGTNQRVAVFNHCVTVNGRHHPFCVSCFWQPEGPIQLTLSGFFFYELESSQILDRPGNQTVLHRAKLVVTPSGKACHASGVQPRDVTKHAISNLCVAISVELQL